MPYDRYTEHPALRPTILASALKTVARPAPASRAEEKEGRETRETPRAA